MEREVARSLERAIRERRVVEFGYHGEARTVEPYILGRVAGRMTLRGWQSRKGWRSFHLAEVEALEVTDRFWEEPREGYAPDPRMDQVLAAV